MSELQAPFVRAAKVSAVAALLAVLLASLFLWRRDKAVVAPLSTDSLSCMMQQVQAGAIKPLIDPCLLVLAIGLGLATLMLDMALRLGVAGGVPYVVMVFTGKWFPERAHVIWLAVIASGLTMLGYLYSPAGSAEWMVLVNRFLALFVIWVTAFVVSTGKASENALKIQAAELRILSQSVEHSPVSVMITDAEGSIEYVNWKFSELTGFDREEVIGKNPRLLQSGETPAEVFDDLWATIAAGYEWRGEFQNRRKDGEVYSEAAAILPIRSVDGEVLHYVSLQEDISKRKQLERQLKHQATHDAMTGLPNRKLAMEYLAAAMAQARRNNSMAAVLFLDLDGFKSVNDKLGHDAGDFVLTQTALRLRACLREVDTLARIGGDEFLVVLTNTADKPSVVTVAEKLIAAVVSPYTVSHTEVVLGVSIGIALYPSGAKGADELLRIADQAMYAVKRQGKNHYVFAGSVEEEAVGCADRAD